MHSRDCVAASSVGLHISLHTRHGDLAAMETLLAGDWLGASAHTERPALPRGHTQNSNLKTHSVTRKTFTNARRHVRKGTDSINKRLSRICQAAAKLSLVTFN